LWIKNKHFSTRYNIKKNKKIGAALAGSDHNYDTTEKAGSLPAKFPFLFLKKV